MPNRGTQSPSASMPATITRMGTVKNVPRPDDSITACEHKHTDTAVYRQQMM